MVFMKGTRGLGRVRRPVEVGHNAAADLFVALLERADGFDAPVRPVIHGKHGGHVDPFDGTQAPQEGGAVLPGGPGRADRLTELHRDLLAVADHGAVDKIRQGLGVHGTGSAHDHQGVVFPPLLPAQRHPPQGEHVQDIAVGELVLEGEADDVEFSEGPFGLEGNQRRPICTEQVLHVGPGSVDPLCRQPVKAVENMVENGETDVAHPHFIDIGKGQGEGEVDLGGILSDTAELPAEIARGAADC